jgi:hypothetical protein
MRRMQTSPYSMLVAVAVGLAAIGCGGDSSPVGPEVPAPKGAVVQGTVVTNLTLSAASLPGDGGGCCSTLQSMPGDGGGGCCTSVMPCAQTRGNGVKVTVVGTDISTVTNSSGQFTLTNVPNGTITLLFQGNGIEATLTIGGLTEGQTLTLVVEVAGKNAKVWNEDDDAKELEFVGRIESKNPPNITVSGHTVVTNGNTEYRPAATVGSLADLGVGDLVQVNGVLQSDGTVLARKIKSKEDTCK